jgi:surface antigen
MQVARARRGVAVMAALSLLLGCAQVQQAEQAVKDNPKAVLGGVVGAAAGGLAVAAFGGRGWAVAAGALGGALIGGYVGNRLDRRDKQLAAEAAAQAFEANRTGEPSVWNNPDTGNHGSVTPTKTYQLASGQYCREYRQEIWVGNEKHQAYGTACRQTDGTWKIES